MESKVHYATIDDFHFPFPYPQMYQEQKDFMEQVKLTLEAKGHDICILEVPPGVGKIEALFSILLEFMRMHDGVGPIIYCTDTYQSYLKAWESFKKVADVRKKVDDPFNNQITAISLGPKRLSCCNNEINQSNDIEDLCFSATCSWSSNKCNAFDNVPSIKGKLHSIQSFNEMCLESNSCPYYTSRRIMNNFSVIFMSHEELIDPKQGRFLLDRLPKDCIICLDNAQFIDDTCCEVMSYKTDLNEIKKCAPIVAGLKRLVDASKGNDESDQLRFGMTISEIEKLAPEGSTRFLSPIPQEYQIDRKICGSIWSAEHFLRKLDYLIKYFYELLNQKNLDLKPPESLVFTSSELLTSINDEIYIEPLELYFMSSRLSHLLFSLKVTDILRFRPVYALLDLVSVLSTFNQSISVNIDGKSMDIHSTIKTVPFIQLSFLDASVAFGRLHKRFKNVIMTSSTLSPPGYYAQILNVEPTTMLGLNMVERDVRHNYPLHVMSVRHGNEQNILRLVSNEIEKNFSLMRSYIAILIEMSRLVPDGIVAYFSSHHIIHRIIRMWRTTGQHEQILMNKLIFVEPTTVYADDEINHSRKFGRECDIMLDKYKRACDNGRGGLLMCVVGGRMARSLDLGGHYCRAAVVFGMGLDEAEIPAVTERARFLDTNFQFPADEFIKFHAVRMALSGLSSVLANKSDFAGIILVDARYGESAFRSKLPLWMISIAKSSQIGQGVEEVKEQLRSFYSKCCNFEYNPNARIELPLE